MKMKLIQPISIWENGVTLEAKILTAHAAHVNLEHSATFYYALHSETADGRLGQMVRNGNVSIFGDEYAQWEQDEYVWNWIASKLNLTITGDFVESPYTMEMPYMTEIDTTHVETEVISNDEATPEVETI
jgi:hypothetical protein